MVAQLLCDPFCKSFDEIADMTDRQIVDICFYPRDDKGAIQPKAKAGAAPEFPDTIEGEAQALCYYGLAVGMSREEILEAWKKKHGDRPMEF